MKKAMYWGLSGLILLIAIAGVVLLMNRKIDTEPTDEGTQQPQQARKPPPAEPGFKWVQQGDHYHKVEVTEPTETKVGEGDKPIEAPKPEVQEYDGPLTYHKELLETNPVKALRLQAEERGHPCAKWIPPFPPDDLEAQAFARKYLSIYLDENDPEWDKAANDASSMTHAIFGSPHGARRSDLLKLTWVE